MGNPLWEPAAFAYSTRVCRSGSPNRRHRWHKESIGLKVDQIRRTKDLELENALLRKLVADLALDQAILKGASKLPS